jgi:deoxycytidylate deaminase
MEAILSASRSGKGSLVGAVLYTTTFPCHNCARHIVAAGISRVYFIEPYPKSLAHDLHPDSIALDERESAKVVFAQYEGVAPKNVFKLFQHGRDRKRDGRVINFNATEATPAYQPYLDSFTLYEDKIVQELALAEGSASA